MRTDSHDRTGVQVGIVGLGRAGSIHLEALHGVAGARVAAVCDARPAARQRAAAAGIRTYASLDAMLDGTLLDGVVVCTPPADHAEISTHCLARGVHVLCEKPLALTPTEVLTMLRTAARARRTLLVSSKFRHVPEVARARALLQSDAIGAPLSFEINFCARVDMRARWNSHHPLSGGGVIIDNGWHAFDIVAHLFGGVRHVQATRARASAPGAVEDSATLQAWAEHGVAGRIELSWSAPPRADTYLVVQGGRGSIEIGWRGARVRHRNGAWHALGGPYDKLAAHRAMHERFVAAMRGGGGEWISAFESLQVAATVDAAYRSLVSGVSEPVRMPDSGDPDLLPASAPAADDAPLAATSD